MTDLPARGRVAIAAISLVVLGAAVGIAADRLHSRPAHDSSAVLRLHEDPMSVLDSALVLDDNQRQQVRHVIEARQNDVDGVWRDTHTRLLAIIDSTMHDLEAVLDTHQIAQLHDLADILHGEGARRILH